MQVVPGAQIIERIERERLAEPGGILAFDGDGTLWSGDVGEDFFHAVVEKGDFRPSAIRALRAEAGEFNLPLTGTGTDLARGLYAAYVEGRYPEERTCEMMGWACAEWSCAEVSAFSDEVVRGGRLGHRLHREVMAIVAWARSVNVEFFLVSASPRPIVEAAAKVIGIDASHVIAATPLYEAEVMLARIERPIPYGPGKVSAIASRATGRPLYAAFGDNIFDVAMLSTSRVPVGVRPKSRLRDRAHDVPGIVELEPLL